MALIRQSHQIGRQIRDRRKALGFSQEQLGELLGVSYQQVQKYEKGLSKLSPERLQQVSAALGIPIRCFFGEEVTARPGMARTDVSIHSVRHTVLAPGERELLRRFRHLGSHADRILILTLIKALSRRISRSR